MTDVIDLDDSLTVQEELAQFNAFVAVSEQGGGGLIPPGQPKGVVFTGGAARDQGRHAIFRVETHAIKGQRDRGGLFIAMLSAMLEKPVLEQ